jgi:CheY-like chemotaxis protein
VSARLPAARPQPRRSLADFWANFNLPERVRAYEARYIRRALIDAGGSVTHAARLLGFNHHAKLAFILKSRHKDLAHLRTPPEKRRRSIVRGRDVTRQSPAGARVIRILHVEDNEAVADAVRDGLEDMGWSVVACADGAAAAEILAGDEQFDLLIFDNDLPGRNGIELLSYARTLPHRRRVPSVMFSSSNVEAEGWGAGADAFSRKPEDVGKLAATVARLLSMGAR